MPRGERSSGNHAGLSRSRNRRTGGLPVIGRRPGRAAIAGARFGVFFTAAAWLGYVVEQTIRLRGTDLTPRTLGEAALYLTLVTLLAASALAYLMARVGYLERARVHRRVPRSTIDDQFGESSPSLTILVPSYREESRVITQTLISAALQEYEGLRIVLLIDDPPPGGDAIAERDLERARSIPHVVQQLLSEPRQLAEDALEAFERDGSPEGAAAPAALEHLARAFDGAAEWTDRTVAGLPRTDHTDEFLAIEVVSRLGDSLRATATAARAAALDPAARVSRGRVRQLHRRLVRTFRARIESFERKRYSSLSHEPNKAMNLNSYIGLMGGGYCSVESPGGTVLVPSSRQEADLVIPDSDYLLTLDADSMLLPEYCLRLIYFMEQEENSRVAVAQTPYSAYQGAPTAIERIAGATTDVQHIVHQGLERNGASFWVGANAVIRKRALDELLVEDDERGFVIRRYIKDRTVIEDTESSVDLRQRAWAIYNYPERLSYSATPSDFGALVVQRRRWANGGLVILPKLLRQIWIRTPGVRRPSLIELFLRVNYLASISWASLGLLILLFYPFEEQLLTRFAVLTAIPYFWAMSTDLHRIGYGRADVFRIYGFNLLLLPVNLAGTGQSLIQAIGGQKIPFARTPKVERRTVPPLLFLVMPVLMVIWSAWTLRRDVADEAYVHGAFAALNFLAAGYACVAFISIRYLVADLAVNLREFIYRPAPQHEVESEVPHWASVLYVESSLPEEIRSGAPLATALAAQDGATADVREVARARSGGASAGRSGPRPGKGSSAAGGEA